MRISDWSSDVCSSDLAASGVLLRLVAVTPVELLLQLRLAVDHRDHAGTAEHDRGVLATGLDQDHRVAGLRQSPGHGTTCRARTDNHIVGFTGVGLQIGRASWRERGCQYV